ncbi:hypothetical protein DXG01_000684 [Tephrocybe rancida]|nr:hypothetical protein DXG01_000684 [Tephrocybe rancida]
MPKFNKKLEKRGLYNHSDSPSISKATTSSAHRVRTLVTRHHDQSQASEMSASLAPDSDTFPSESDTMSMDVDLDLDDDLGPINSGNISGIMVITASLDEPSMKRDHNSDNPFLMWIKFREKYLDSLLMLEGQGWQPLHIVQVWREDRFHKISLTSINQSIFRVQLGHPARSSCTYPEPANKDFMVFHTNGLHSVQVDFCGCRDDYPRYQQVLDVGWFPATVFDPQTCGTFEMLRQFQVLNLQGKVSAFDYFVLLKHLTDATGLTKVADRLASFMIMVREWRHLKAAKCAARAHDDAGISGTEQGGFAIECRVCPHPKNLPPGWENAPAKASWLYQLILSQDANFHLKNRLCSSDAKDPSLQPGFAYFLESDEYLRHLAKYVDHDEVWGHVIPRIARVEISHCVGFAAIWAANKKKSKGLHATGVGSVSCARHQLFHPTGTGDLQKGENLFGTFILHILLCYDIACQYGINFWSRFKDIPSRVQFVTVLTIRFKVPKFHLPPHKAKCHGPFSLNYTSGVGRTDGEGVERNWAWLNGAAPSTSQMGPGSRHDTLDDFMGFWNYHKTVDFGKLGCLDHETCRHASLKSGESLLKNLVKAIPEAILHRDAFTAFTDGLRKEHLEDLKQWERMLIEWESDKTKPDPYLVEEDSVTVSEIRRQLAEEEHERVQSGNISGSLDVTASGFIISGLSIEEDQMSLRLDASKKHMTPTQEETLQHKRTALHKYQKFREVQGTFMPGLPVLDDTDIKPELLELHLPSSLSIDSRSRCLVSLPDIEDRLRVAHMGEALSSLRCHLRTQTFAKKFQDENVKSQAAYTLRGPGNWEITYCVLLKEDIRGVNERTVIEEEREADEDACAITGAEALARTTSTLRLQTGEGRRLISWIWFSVTSGEIDQDADNSLHDGLHLEWMKARAQAERWREEVILLEEEM